jgi:hypothetical protein
MRVIAVDFDGTASVNPEAVNKLYNQKDNVIIIYTARPNSIRKQTEEELTKLGINYHSLVMDKLRADVYIDDKNAGGLKWIES